MDYWWGNNSIINVDIWFTQSHENGLSQLCFFVCVGVCEKRYERLRRRCCCWHLDVSWTNYISVMSASHSYDFYQMLLLMFSLHCACAHSWKRLTTIPFIKIVRLKTVCPSPTSCVATFVYPLQMLCFRPDKQSLCEGLPERQNVVSMKAWGSSICSNLLRIASKCDLFG